MSCSSSCTIFLNCTNQKTSSDLERSTKKLKKKKTHTRPHQRPRKQCPPSPPPFGQEQSIQTHHQSCQRFTALGTLIICIICGCCIHRIQLLVHRTRQVLPELPATWCLWFSIVLAEHKRWKHLGISKVEPKNPFWNKDGLCVWELQIASKLIFSEMPVFRMVASRN